MPNENQTKIKIAALSDIHIKKTSEGAYKELFGKINKDADILALCGDLTDLGLIEEARILVNELKILTIPVVAVLGNHDYETNLQNEITNLLVENKINVLEGSEYVFEKDSKKIGFTGVKGFGGGFQPYMWGRFGEEAQKAFYDAIASEVQNLENGISKIQDETLAARFVLLHFAPIRETCVGDIVEMYPFLGSTRLEEVIDRYKNITGVIHGHSHHGTPEGKTAKGIPVYNVAYPLMQREFADKPYRIIKI